MTRPVTINTGFIPGVRGPGAMQGGEPVSRLAHNQEAACSIQAPAKKICILILKYLYMSKKQRIPTSWRLRPEIIKMLKILSACDSLHAYECLESLIETAYRSNPELPSFKEKVADTNVGNTSKKKLAPETLPDEDMPF